VIDNAPDWVKATLDLPMINDPGSKDYYCSGGVAVVGRLIENKTHMPLPDFAQANLFGPLGIAPSDWTWNYDLTMPTKSTRNSSAPARHAQAGILFAGDGRWHGRR